ncbi:haloacid dehalogenase-like hydrolase domain-containing protein [Ditylenchus destructor]|nr:haloacid dehalogenase-like hydrolase domain-containing protein [Ditylenchus destructor]
MVKSEGLNITHIIFDFDGVLIDSERQYTIANSRCLANFGGGPFTVEMKNAQMGRKKPEVVRVALEMDGLIGKVDDNEYMKHYDLLLEELIPLALELSGASKLIDHFHSRAVPLAICTGSDNEEFALKMRRYSHWLEKIPLTQVVLSGSDPEVKNGKPHPDPYLVTLKRFAVPPLSPSNVLVFEDSINGVRSALAAGLNVIMVPQKEYLPSDWNEIKPTLKVAEILESLDHFDPAKYGLPGFIV